MKSKSKSICWGCMLMYFIIGYKVWAGSWSSQRRVFKTFSVAYSSSLSRWLVLSGLILTSFLLKAHCLGPQKWAFVEKIIQKPAASALKRPLLSKKMFKRPGCGCCNFLLWMATNISFQSSSVYLFSCRQWPDQPTITSDGKRNIFLWRIRQIVVNFLGPDVRMVQKTHATTFLSHVSK